MLQFFKKVAIKFLPVVGKVKNRTDMAEGQESHKRLI